MSPTRVVFALAPAALICGVIMLIAWRPWRRGASQLRRDWSGPMGIGCGFATSFLILNNGWPGSPPHERWQWILFMAIAAMAIGFVASLWRPVGWLRFLISMVLAILIGTMLHPPSTNETSVVWRVGLAALVLIQSMSLDHLAKRRAGASLPLAMWLIFSGVSFVLLQSGNAIFSLMAAAVAAMLGAIVVLALLNPRLSLAHGASHVLAALLSGWLVIGWLYNGTDAPIVPLAGFAILAVAPLMLWIGEARFITRMKTLQAAAIRVGLVTIPVLIAVGMAMKATESVSAS